MIKSAFLALTFLLILCPAAHAERPAGILLYFKAGTEVYLLLADHATPGSKDRGWGGFGGGPESGESPAETAARETAEETRGFFLVAALLKQIESQTPVIDTNGFALFFAEIPFVPVQQVANYQPENMDRAYFERGPFAWIPFSEVKRHLVGDIDGTPKYSIDKHFLPAGSRSEWFWSVWIGNMRMVLETHALPWLRE